MFTMVKFGNAELNFRIRDDGHVYDCDVILLVIDLVSGVELTVTMPVKTTPRPYSGNTASSGTVE